MRRDRMTRKLKFPKYLWRKRGVFSRADFTKHESPVNMPLREAKDPFPLSHFRSCPALFTWTVSFHFGFVDRPHAEAHRIGRHPRRPAVADRQTLLVDSPDFSGDDRADGFSAGDT